MKRVKPSKGQRRVLENGSEVILIEPKQKQQTYIKSDFEYEEGDLRNETNPHVYCKQKWVVDLVEVVFGKERLFRCVREIHWILGPYLRRHTDEHGNEIIKIRELE